MDNGVKKEIAPQDRVRPVKLSTGDMGRPALNITKKQIEYAIHSTQSMRKAADYLNVSYKTFKKYAIQFDLWAPLKSNKGIRRNSFSNTFGKYDIGAILSGEYPSPYREEKLMLKAFREGFIECSCSNCTADYTKWDKKTPPPLVIDFLDTNPTNTRVENIRILCFNCVYELHNTDKAWYKYRDNPLHKAILELPTPTPPSSNTLSQDSSDTLTSSTTLSDDILSEHTPNPPIEAGLEPQSELKEFIPFEEFQKTLDN